jgi:hypothetical protein
MLLAEVKLQHNVRDDNSAVALLALRIFRRQITSAHKYLDSVAPQLRQTLQQRIQTHLELERTAQIVGLEDYLRPTAQAFAEVLAALPVALRKLDYHQLFHTLGNHLGAALLAYDCAVDWRRDLTERSFNPVAARTSAKAALRRSIEHLEEVKMLCSRYFGGSSQSTRLVDGVINRLTHQARALPMCQSRASFILPVLTQQLKQLFTDAHLLRPGTTTFCCEPVTCCACLCVCGCIHLGHMVSRGSCDEGCCD